MSKALKSFSLINDIWYFLSNKRKYQIIFTLIIMIVSAFVELVSLASTVPFLYVISSNPDKLFEISFFQIFNKFLRVNNSESLLLIVIIVFIISAILSGFFRTLNLYLTTRMTAVITTDFSNKAYNILLSKPFNFYINSNSSGTITSLTNYIDDFVAVIFATLELLTGILTSSILSIGILLINPSSAISSLLTFGIAYFILSKFINKRLRANSFKIANFQKNQVKTVQESIGSIRNILLDNLGKYFSLQYSLIDSKMRIKKSQNQFLTYFPKSIFESIALIFIAIFTYVYSKNYFKTLDLIPILGSLAIGLQKILPALQKIYASWASLGSYGEGASRIIEIYKNKNTQNIPKKLDKKLLFNKSIVLRDICYAYEGKNSDVINKLNLEIFKGDRIVIIGNSGAGKSTFIDIIMCLLRPTKGQIKIDGKDLYSNSLIPSYQKLISHVPQEVFLADTTILENIAIGIPTAEIDFFKVKKCAEMACISAFIEKLPKNFYTQVGERGAKLSVGQKQRIGIARSFYKNAEILILDEATSALDSETEELVLNSIKNINPNITILMVSHRLNTITKFNKILKIEKSNIRYISSNDIN